MEKRSGSVLCTGFSTSRLLCFIAGHMSCVGKGIGDLAADLVFSGTELYWRALTWEAHSPIPTASVLITAQIRTMIYQENTHRSARNRNCARKS